MSNGLTTEQIADIKARADDWYEDSITVYNYGVGQCEPARDDVYALIAAYERLAALLEDARRERDQLESEVSVCRVTVLGVNAAAGQGED